jgi:membrane protease YdiL (CAAX protease family)
MVVFGFVFGLAFFISRVTPGELLLRWRGIFKPVWQGAAYSIALRLGVEFLIRLMFIVLIVVGLMAPYQILDIGAAHGRGVERIVSASALHHDRIFFWLSLTLVSFVFAGLREELWRSAFFAGVRALWPQNFKSRLGQIGVAAFAAIMFGFGHTLEGSLAVLHAGIMGFGFGLIMIFHRSIWPAVIAHGFFDATSMAIMAFSHGH